MPAEETQNVPEPEPEETEADPVSRITPKQMRLLNVLLSHAGLNETRERAHEWISGVLGQEIASRKDLTLDQASELIDRLSDGEQRRKVVSAEKPTVFEAISAVMEEFARIGVGKGGFNREQGYSFRAIDDFVNVGGPILAAMGVIITPQVLETVITERSTRSGGVQMFAQVTVRYIVYGPAGDFIEPVLVGMGSDTSDKATNKALTGAYKYLLGQLFAVPLIGQTDGDLTSPQTEPPPAEDNTPLWERIVAYAKKAGVGLEEFTAKARHDLGDVTLEQFERAPRDILYGFVRRLEAWEEKQAAEKPPEQGQEQPPAGQEGAPQQ